MEVSPEFRVILQKKVSRELHRSDVLLAIPSVWIRLSGCGLSLRAEVVAHVKTSAQHEGKSLAESDIELGVAIDAVFQLVVCTFVGDEIGVVLASGQVGVLRNALLPCKPVVLCPRHINVGGVGPEAVHH